MLPDTFLKCVAFVTCNKKESRPLLGTAFFLQEVALGKWHTILAVTALHVIEAARRNSVDEFVSLRVNTKEGTLGFIRTKIENWIRHPHSSCIDVAIHFLNPAVLEKLDIACFPSAEMRTKGTFGEHPFGLTIGSPVYFPGLFSEHPGVARNIPIMRIGTIAALPDEKVSTDKMGMMHAHLIEARSIGGLSGSPVFAEFYSGFRNFDGKVEGQGVGLIGLVHGHWDIGDGRHDVSEVDGMLSKASVNMGMAIVVPAESILEVLNQERVMAMREENLRKLESDVIEGPSNETNE